MKEESSQQLTEPDPQIELLEAAPAETRSAEDEDDIVASQQAIAEPGVRISTDDMRRELDLSSPVTRNFFERKQRKRFVSDSFRSATIRACPGGAMTD